MQITAEDFVPVERDDVFRSIQWRLTHKRRYTGTLSTYGKRPIDIDLVRTDLGDIESAAVSAETVRFLIATANHTAHIADNAVRLFLPLLNGTNLMTIRHSGIESYWDAPTINDFMSLRGEVLGKLLSPIAEQVDDPSKFGFPANSLYSVFRVKEHRFDDDYIGNPLISSVARAVWLERRSRLSYALANTNLEAVTRDGQFLLSTYHHRASGTVRPTAVNDIITALSYLNRNDKITVDDIRNRRHELLNTQASRQRVIDHQRRMKAGERFASFWSSMKDARPPQSSELAHAEFCNIPLKESGTETSRTWGIEIETVRANQTSRPAGWRSEYDGSLPDSTDCSCDCDSCCDNDHCADEDYDCRENGEANYESREFVSPILRHFNSEGLRKLCNDLGARDDEDYRPGIHVHVGADDLSVFDITRLLVSYSAIEHLLEPLLHRKERNYCKATSTDQLRWWLGKLREFQRTSPDKLPTPQNVLYNNSDATPQGRYVDVNIQALNEHGTIEFRSMGAWYDYNHLVRWAWLVREMVNVSKLGIDQAEWTACKSVADVVNLLRKYGSEIPSSALFPDVDSSSLLLTADEA